MLGFVRTDNEALASCLGDPQRAVAAYHELLQRGQDAVGAIRAGLDPDLRAVIAATYHQVWWPSTSTVRYGSDHLPAWHERTGRYLDPKTGELLPTWDQALDAIGAHDQPLHVARFGPKFDAQGVLAGTRDAQKCIGYLTKYLTKQLARCHRAETDAQAADRGSTSVLPTST